MSKLSIEVDLKDIFLGDPDNEGGYQSDYDVYESLRDRVEERVVKMLADEVRAYIKDPMQTMARAIERHASREFEEKAAPMFEERLRKGGHEAWGFDSDKELDAWIKVNLRYAAERIVRRSLR